MTRAIPVIFLAAVALAGCESVTRTAASSYDQGYHNGCLNGEALNAPYMPRPDPEMMATDGKYRQGWYDGFSRCYDLTVSAATGESWHP